MEIGASGRIWDRDSTIRALTGDPGDESRISEVFVSLVSDDAALATYVVAKASTTEERPSRRGSLWIQGESGWRIRFDQGTPVEERPRDDGGSAC